MFTISKDFEFAASHQLTLLPETHKCSRLHGHNYVVKVTVNSGVLNKHGFVVDYAELTDFKTLLDTKYDHRHLNNILETPTAENLAEHFYKEVAIILAQHFVGRPWQLIIGVSETPKTWATFKGEPSV